MKRLQYEIVEWTKGNSNILGIDEVGRGCLAGPLVLGGVILKKEKLLTLQDILTNLYTQNNAQTLMDKKKPQLLPKVEDLTADINIQNYYKIKDSKKLTEKQREELSQFIIDNAKAYAIVEISPAEIDKLGMSRATQKAFMQVIAQIRTKIEVINMIFTDKFAIEGIKKSQQLNILGGDNLSMSVAAASIIAKVYRDNLVSKLSEQDKYAHYQFHKHKGYGTALHKELILKHGPCDIHRFSFEPIKSYKK